MQENTWNMYTLHLRWYWGCKRKPGNLQDSFSQVQRRNKASLDGSEWAPYSAALHLSVEKAVSADQRRWRGWLDSLRLLWIPFIPDLQPLTPSKSTVCHWSVRSSGHLFSAQVLPQWETKQCFTFYLMGLGEVQFLHPLLRFLVQPQEHQIWPISFRVHLRG